MVEAIRPFWNELPNLKKIIVWGEKESETLYSNLVLRWEDVMSLGNDLDDKQLLERWKNMAINQCCILIYTSGTTGNPKGNYDEIQTDFPIYINIFQTIREYNVFSKYRSYAVSR